MVQPVTAIAIQHEFLLCAAGSNIELYYKHEPNERLWTCKVFSSQAVHGLSVQKNVKDEALVVAWGGRNICVLTLDKPLQESKNYPVVQQLASASGSDWILYCAIKPSSEDDDAIEAVFVTAHNALVNVTIQYMPKLSISLRNAVRGHSVMLYVAHISWLECGTILVAAGTAFGQIDVWSYLPVDERDAHPIVRSRICRHFFYEAHDGSIFGLDVLVTPNYLHDTFPALLIASCSDDRNIRIWNCANLLGKLSPSDRSDDSSIYSVAPPCLARTWAHASRIWAVTFLPPSQQECGTEVRLITCGEDSTCQLWALSGSADESRMERSNVLTNIANLIFHEGKNIWSMAFRQNSSGDLEVVTGGADGAVQTKILPRNNSPLEMLCSSENGLLFSDLELTDTDASSRAIQRADGFKTYGFVGPHTLLVTSTQGNIYEMTIITVSKTLGFSGKLLGSFPCMKSYSVTAGIPELSLGFVTGNDGTVFCYWSGYLFPSPILITGRKPGAMFCQKLQDCASNNSTVECADTAVVIMCPLGSPELILGFVNMTHVSTGSPGEVYSVKLDLSPDFIVTCVHVEQISDSERIICVASRQGTFAAYALQKADSEWETRSLAVSPNKLHSDAITSLLWSRPVSLAEHGFHRGCILTTGRDSTFAIHQYHYEEDAISLNTLHQVTLPFGPNIEGAYLSLDEHLLFYGFHGKQFVVFDETAHRQESFVTCGGAHRVWAFQPSSKTFLWTKVSRLHAIQWSRAQSRVIKLGGHGREIKTCASVSIVDEETNHTKTLIATGAEDTNIRIFECKSCGLGEQYNLECVAVLIKHNTGIQQLKWSNDGRFLISSAGCEELFVWRISRVSFVPLGAVCESRLPQLSSLSDLRIMDFEISGYNPKFCHGDKFVRCSASMCITMVMSDSTIRQYSYSSSQTSNKWNILFKITFTTCCLTQIVNLKPSKNSRQLQDDKLKPTWTFIAGTDGHVSAWKDKGTLDRPDFTFVHARSIHQNAVKSIQWDHVAGTLHLGSVYVVITTGDDNAIGISLVALDDESEKGESECIKGFETLLVPRAHSASVTSSLLVQLREKTLSTSKQVQAMPRCWKLITTGNDQRLKTWSIDINLGVDSSMLSTDMIKVRRDTNQFASIADAAAITLVDTSGTIEQLEEDREITPRSMTIAVSGVGMDLFDINL